MVVVWAKIIDSMSFCGLGAPGSISGIKRIKKKKME
jgi:hypothetical protein